MSTFSKRLKELRIEQNLTIYSLSKKTGISPKTLKSYEEQKTKPSIKRFIKIVSALNVSCNYLLGLSDSRQISNQKNKK